MSAHLTFNAFLSSSDNFEKSTAITAPSIFIYSLPNVTVAPLASPAVIVAVAPFNLAIEAPVVTLPVEDTPLGPACEPSSNFIVLNSVVSEILVNSSCNCLISLLTASLSSSVSVPLAACTESSLILCKIECDSFNAPSAVWISEIPSWAFEEALLRPLICPLIFSEIERPAASSAALLIL